ncbi:hypothetical protein AK812_SmicGene1326 [Symbiodinium microadriaticum]|uniref:Uncharacterized protein n=1 Tax=Symbiodinium microadriaticum TaxID=2951 RepID=A0A1Q9F4J9_SYMMI|nr:hypothetical protein AK812_SmicGene1326 [Symbiodinium microadriaticum]
MVKRVADLTDLPLKWESIRALRIQAARGLGLFVSTVPGQAGCLGNLKDCSANHEALKAILFLMTKSRTIETPTVDALSEKGKMFLEESNYPDKTSLVAVAHRDAWSAKRCLTTLKRKWIRHEMPKDKFADAKEDIAVAALAPDEPEAAPEPEEPLAEVESMGSEVEPVATEESGASGPAPLAAEDRRR